MGKPRLEDDLREVKFERALPESQVDPYLKYLASNIAVGEVREVRIDTRHSQNRHYTFPPKIQVDVENEPSLTYGDTNVTGTITLVTKFVEGIPFRLVPKYEDDKIVFEGLQFDTDHEDKSDLFIESVKRIRKETRKYFRDPSSILD